MFKSPFSGVFKSSFGGDVSGPPKEGLLLYAKPTVDIIGVSTGPTQPGRGYTGTGTIAITGLLTTDTITAASPTTPTCVTDGVMTVSADVWGPLRVTRYGEVLWESACAEGQGLVSINRDKRAAWSFPDGVMSGLTHAIYADGTGSDLNQEGFSAVANLMLRDLTYHETGNISVVLTGTNQYAVSKITTAKYSSILISDEGRLNTDTSITCKAKVRMRAGAAHNKLELVWYSGDSLNNLGTILSGPGSITGSGTPTLTNLSTTEWTEVTIVRDSLTVGLTRPRFYLYPGGATSEDITDGFEVKDMQFYFGTIDRDFTDILDTPYRLRPKSARGIPGEGIIAGIGDSLVNGHFVKLATRYLESADDMLQAGVGGDTATDVIARFVADVVPYNPDITFLVVGVNDVFGGKLATVLLAEVQQIVALMDTYNITPVLVTIAPCGEHVSWTQDIQDQLEAYNTSLIAYGLANGIQVVNNYDLMVDPGTDNAVSFYVNADKLHFSSAGYVVSATAISVAIDNIWGTTTGDTINGVLTYPGRLKYNLEIVSGTGPSDWVVTLPQAPELIAALGLDNAYYNAAGVPQNINYTTLMAMEGDQVWGSEERQQVAIYDEDLTGDDLVKAQRYFKVAP